MAERNLRRWGLGQRLKGRQLRLQMWGACFRMRRLKESFLLVPDGGSRSTCRLRKQLCYIPSVPGQRMAVIRTPPVWGAHVPLIYSGCNLALFPETIDVLILNFPWQIMKEILKRNLKNTYYEWIMTSANVPQSH